MGERTKQEKVKDKRKALLEARLAKVRQRRNIKPDIKPTSEIHFPIYIYSTHNLRITFKKLFLLF